MLAKSVQHLSYLVRDLERARGFYEGLLGLETIERPDIGLPGVWYRAGDCEVHLIEAPSGVEPPAAPSLSPLANHNAFVVESYEKTLALLKTRGAEVFETSPERGQLWIQDPDGNVIELIELREA